MAYNSVMNQFELVFYPHKMDEFQSLDERVRAWIGKNASQFVIAHHKEYSSEIYSNEEHYHYFIKTRSSWDLNILASSLGLKEEQIEKIHTKWKTSILYARHINQGDKGKPLIPSSDIETNIEDYDNICEKALSLSVVSPSVSSRGLPRCVIDYAENKIPYSKLLSLLSFAEFNKYKKDIDNARIYRQKKGIDRDMKVIYINGPAGSGKTTLAKFIGTSQGYDIFISGSGNDPFDGYDNEECIILDDLRADVFTKAELFKLLDNNTNSSVKSRYFNKAITRCRLLIITSIKSPQGLYSWEGVEGEPFAQLARRLSFSYLLILPNGIINEVVLNSEDPLNGNPSVKKAPFTMELVQSYFGFRFAAPQGLTSLMDLSAKRAREEMEKKKNG